MSEEVYIAILSIAGSIILLMIGVLGYFLKRIINTLDKFNNTLQTFSSDFAAHKEKVYNMQGNCTEAHRTLNYRLRDHDKRIDKNEKDIAVLQEKTKTI